MSIESVLQTVIEEPVYLKGLNPEQRSAVSAPADQPVKVLAGAGTGKTKLIAHRFVKLADDLCRQGVEQPTDRILAVTFTVKAAAEMQARINQQLQEMGMPPISSEHWPEHWISNFHGFCHRLLRQHAALIGLTPELNVLDDVHQTLAFDRLLKKIRMGDCADLRTVLSEYGLSGRVMPDVLSLSALSTFSSGPDSDFSGSDFLDRVPDIIRKIKAAGLTPEAFHRLACKQALGFTERLKTLTIFAPICSQPLDSHEAYCQAWTQDLTDWREAFWTFSGTAFDKDLFYQKTWEKAVREGKITDQDIFNDDEDYYRDRVKWLYDVKVQGQNLYVDHVKKTTKKRPEHFLPGCMNFSELEKLTDIELQTIDRIAACYALYQAQLQAENAFDFDDLVNRSVELLTRYPHLRQAYQQQFEAIIVDEFQDSNGSQLELLKQLSRNGGENLTVVGDMKQSIYGFRYAQPENMDLVFGHHPVQTVVLKTNYRSVAEIVSVSNILTRYLMGSDLQTLTTANSPSPTSVRLGFASSTAAASPSRGEAISSFREKDFPSPPEGEGRVGGRAVTWVVFGQSKEIGEKPEPIGTLKQQEARWIVSEILRLTSEEDYRPQDVMILAKNHGKAEILYQALKAASIPVTRQKNRSFFQEPVIKDILALFRLMMDLHNNAALVRILQTRLNQRQIRVIAGQARLLSGSFFTVLEKLADGDGAEQEGLRAGLPPTVCQALISLVTELTELKRTAHLLSPGQLFSKLGERIGFVRNLPAKMQGGQDLSREEDWMLIRSFKNLLYQLSTAADRPLGLVELLTLLDAYRREPNAEIPMADAGLEDDAVQILTVHAAKGLEKPVVLVAYTEADRRPAEDAHLIFDPQHEGKAGFGLILGKNTAESAVQTDSLKKLVYRTIWQKPRHEAEQKRLFYVAVTRAQERLYVLRAKQSAPWTDPALFNECPIRLIEVSGEEVDSA